MYWNLLNSNEITISYCSSKINLKILLIYTSMISYTAFIDGSITAVILEGQQHSMDTEEHVLVCTRGDMERLIGRDICLYHWNRFIDSLGCEDSIADSLNYFLDMTDDGGTDVVEPNPTEADPDDLSFMQLYYQSQRLKPRMIEDRLRRALKRRGFLLHKSRRKWDAGMFTVINIRTSTIEAGPTMSVEDVQNFIEERRVVLKRNDGV
jgi:hypothetical protein